MKTYDLSIVIPSLREEFISNTVEDIIKNKRGNTEVIVVLDGEWGGGIPDHPDVRIIKLGKNLGQRGATNVGVRMSRAKYVAKTDAHVAFDEGFDVKLLEAIKDDWTIVPVMRNLHVFNWRCTDCGDESYQGPPPEGCKNCDVNTPDRFEKKVVWFAKPSPNSSAFKFTPNRLQFKYFNSLKSKQQRSGEQLVESMSLQGSFFMLSREKYWELNISDESWGGWGQQGTEVALKTWLSGGRVVCHLGTWYAHMFRTQGNFAFPWGNPAKQQSTARKKSWDTFFNNNWDKQIRPLSWLIERFWNELQQEPDRDDDPRWTTEDLMKLKATEGKFKNGPTKGVLYFTDNDLQMRYARPVRRRLEQIAVDKGMELVSSTRKTTPMGKNVVTRQPKGYQTYFTQILKGLKAMTADIVFMAEHDVLYPPEHFDFTPTDKETFYYDVNWWKVHTADGFCISWEAKQVSGLCAYREVLLDYYTKRLETFSEENFDRKFEPDSKVEEWKAVIPYVDLRTGKNLTYNKRSIDDFRDKSTAKNLRTGTIEDIEGWDKNLLSTLLK